MKINPAQLKRLQTLYGQYERHTLDVDGGRTARLAWASERCGRPVASFSDLTLDEGRKLIDTIQGVLSVKVPSKTPRKRMDRRSAMEAGTAGRRDNDSREIRMAGPADFERIQREMDRLGWDVEGLRRFLLGSRNPIKGSQQVRTLWEANRVYWALKNIPARKEQLAS